MKKEKTTLHRLACRGTLCLESIELNCIVQIDIHPTQWLGGIGRHMSAHTDLIDRMESKRWNAKW